MTDSFLAIDATPIHYRVDGAAGAPVLVLSNSLGTDLSMGGMTGMWLGVHAPDRIAKLALCNTAAYIGPSERWDARVGAVRAGGMAAIAQTVIGVWFTPPFLAREPGVTGAIREQLERTSPDRYIAACAAIRDTDLRDAIGAIQAPTLVVAGAHDGSTPPTHGRFLAERIPGARYVELDAAHLSNIEAAPRFNEALVSFLLA